MRRPALLIPCLISAWLAACSGGPVPAPIGDRTHAPARIPAQHRVQTGDTLYSIAFQYGRSVEELARWNGIRKPYTIYKGQIIRLVPPPRARRKAAAPPPVAASRPKTNPAARRGDPATAEKSSHQKKKPSPAADKKKPPARIRWAWPASGPLLRHFDADGSGRKGIDIGGKPGSPVRAAADGKVVYAGSGLGGYGRLIIIKHNKDFLSAYAHNRKLIAKEGQWVKKGELIARMGNSASDRTRLHFEIRKRGRPVDPLRYLPRR